MGVENHSPNAFSYEASGEWTRITRVIVDNPEGMRYHRATKIVGNGKTVVVSSVGRWYHKDFGMEMPIGYNRFFETLVFAYNPDGTREEVAIRQPNTFPSADVPERETDKMHDSIVDEMIVRVEKGDL